VQPPDGIEGGQDRALLPTPPIGRVLAGEQDASIDRAQISVVLFARLIGPSAFAAERRGSAMPRDSDAILEFVLVLGMDLGRRSK
jgi:hypothetical protein